MTNVRGYFRKDGTWVRAHQRSAPRRIGLAATATFTAGGIAVVAVTLPPGGHAPKQARVQAIPAVAEAGFRRSETTLAAAGYRTVLAKKLDTECAANSYGRVRAFFRRHPCDWLARAYLQIGESEILVAISWVGMPSASLAGEYKHLIDTPGAGGVTELSRAVKLYRYLDYASSAHTSGNGGTAVWNVQVRPVYPRPPAEITKVLLAARQ
ncbi:hypothetical protein [Actinomadura sp. DC4]|uniref:hypothetical protein n=1 Tax=Actinomadura sp. DC4 TaxID=3055069 RepID=UPI0025AEF944|nr:hypothetical protein [Actinomadura sp. DC4]MDN3356725.1 hypothetical protein [Actinomadura sp. DC4]